jgi:hypothetical protein
MTAGIGRIGFGTGSLYGGREHARSLALVRTALDAGIQWIDTAPLYGHGAAEAIVGEAISGRRDEIMLVSKAGILPSRITASYRVRGKLAVLASRLPGGERILPAPPPLRPSFHVFDPAAVRASVERSLKALRTDRLDRLLLHECDPDEAREPALLDLLQSLVQEGKILGFGLATQRDKTLRIADGPAGARFSVLQLPGDEPASPLGLVPLRAGQGVVLHTLLGPRLKAVLALLANDADARARAAALGIDPDQPDLARRLLAHAARQQGVVAALFSTSDPTRLRAAADAISISAEAAAAGAELMAEAGAGRIGSAAGHQEA